MDLNKTDAAGTRSRRREALRIAECTRPNAHGGRAVHCLECSCSDVRLAHVQVGTSVAGELITHRINVVTGEAASNDGTPVAGRLSATSQATRVALTFECAGCGYAWAAILPQEKGTTYVYEARPTIGV